MLEGVAAGYGGDRRRPVTGGAVRGSRRAVGLASEGRGEAAAPQRRVPRVNPGRLRRVTLAALPSRLLAPVLAAPGRGRQARRAGGAPLKVVSRESCNSSGSATYESVTVSQGHELGRFKRLPGRGRRHPYRPVRLWRHP